MEREEKEICLHPCPSVVFSDHVHLLIMFVPRLNKISWVVFIVLAGKSSSFLYLCVVHLGSTGQLLVVAVLACVKPVKFTLPEV